MNSTSSQAIVRAHWGDDAPDWILVLADHCAKTSQAAAARAIGYSAAVISTVLRGTYAGNLDKVELAVRGAFMDGKVDCPALGEISGQACVEHQRNSVSFRNTNPHRIRMFRACRSCPRNHSNQRGE